MAVKIRLKRTGARNNMCYRVVAADSRSPRDGRFIEQLGWYAPTRKDDRFNIDTDRIDYWCKQGAQVSDTVKNLMKQARAAS